MKDTIRSRISQRSIVAVGLCLLGSACIAAGILAYEATAGAKSEFYFRVGYERVYIEPGTVATSVAVGGVVILVLSLGLAAEPEDSDLMLRLLAFILHLVIPVLLYCLLG